MAGRFGRCGAGRSALPLVSGIVGCAAIAATSLPAFAQVATPGSNATTTTQLNVVTGTIDGGGGPGYFVTQGATLVVNNGSLQNFTTTGGGGAGGGLGAGGAIFIDTGGAAIINNSSFINNRVIGGAATNSQYGGTLNNGVANNYFNATSNGTTGINGIIFQDNALVFGQGPTGSVNGGSGMTPCSAGAGGCAGTGGNAINGFGGVGGIGGPATNGWGVNPVAIFTVATAATNVAVDTTAFGVTTSQAILLAVFAIGHAAAAADIFELPSDLLEITKDTSLAIQFGIDAGLNTVTLANDAASLALAVAQLEAWNNAACINLPTPPCVPTHGNGGTGANGGSGGNGSYGFGGGTGGMGGAYGTGGNPNSLAGVGGSGGTGGNGGFGGGGGAGGAGYSGTDFGAAGPPSQVPTSSVSGFPEEATGGFGTPTNGSGGAGGIGGFGGGIGCTGGVGATGACSGGGGGNGYGGAIFVNSGATLTITGNVTFFGNNAVAGQSQTGGTPGTSAGTDLFLMTGSTVNIAPGAGNVVTFNGTIADDSPASIGINPNSPPGTGAGLTIFAGTTVFNGANTFSGQTVIEGGALNGPLNTAANNGGAFSTIGTPNYALTDGALQVTTVQVTANGGTKLFLPTLPTTSNLNFAGPDQFTGGVLQTSGTFSRQVGTGPGQVQWTGSGGFAAIGAPLTVTLGASSALGGQLVWGSNGFVPFGSSLIFGSATSNSMVTFTNPLDITGGIASILVGDNGNPAGSVATISGVISGSGGLSIGGGGFNGNLILSAINTYTGATEIHSGTLSLGGSGSIASSSGLTIDPGAVFDISHSSAGVSIPTLSGTGTIALGATELTVNQTSTFGGSLIDGSGGTGGSLIVSGAGTVVTLSGTNTYTGDTTINAGTKLALSGVGSIANSTPVLDNGTFDISQSTIGGAMITTLSGSGTVDLGSKLLMITAGAAGPSGTASNGVFSGVIQDGGSVGSLAVSGGIQTLSGNNTYTGATMVGSGATLALQGNGTIATSAFLNDNGTFDISQTHGAAIKTLMGTGTVALGAQALTITNGATTTFSGVIADSGVNGGTAGSLIVAGGIQGLSGINTYTGDTIIAPNPSPGLAVLALLGTGSIATSSKVEIATGGAFDISLTTNGASIKTLADFGASPNGTVNLGSQKLTLTAGSTTFSGVIADGGHSGSLEVSGGIQTLAGMNTYTGTTTIDAGATLALLNGGSIAASSGVVANGSFDISQTTSGASITTLSGSGNVALGGSSQTLNITAANGIFSGVIADGGISATNKTGGNLRVSAGFEALSGANTYTGLTTVDLGAGLVLTGSGSIASSRQVTDNGTIDISTTTNGASFTTLAGTNSAALLSLGTQSLTITAGNSTNFAGIISGSGALNIAGGTQVLSGANAYTGPTAINSGATLALAGTGSIATSSEVLANGKFDISGTTAGASIVTLSGSGSVALGSQFLTLTAAAAGSAGTNPAGIFTGTIGGLGGLAITGGHEELRGSNTYSGGTTISNGAVVSINSSSSLGAANSTLTLNNGGVMLDNSLTIPQPVTLLGAPPSVVDFIDLNSHSVTLSGALTGPGVLTAINGGTLNLTGTVNGIGGIVLGTGTTLTANATANAGLGATPIVLVSTGGTATALFTGSVHVVGPLDVTNGATPELIILPGDSLVGVGSVNIAVVIQGGGANAPGDGPGTIVVNASVTNLPNSTFNVDIDGATPSTGCPNPAGCAGQYSSIIVTGGNTYTADGAIAPNLRNIGAPANNNYTPPVTTNFTVVTALGGVLGTFSSLTQPTSGLAPGTRFDALYVNALGALSPNAITFSQNAAGNPNTVELWVTPASYQNLSAFNVTLNKNQSQVAFALDALRGINDLNPALSLPAGLKNNAQATWDFGQLFRQQPQNLPGVFKTLNGEVNTDLRQAAVQMTNQFLELMLDPAVSGRSGGLGGTPVAFAGTDSQQSADGQPSADSQQMADAKLAYASVMKQQRPAATFDQRWTSWGSAFGGAVNATGDPLTGSTDVTLRTYGIGGGMDYHFGDSVVGFAVAGGNTSWGLSQSLGTGRSDVFLAGVYSATHFGPAYLASALSFANHWANTDRLALAGDHLKSSFDAQSYGVRVEAGYRIDNAIVAVTPYIAGEYQRFDTPNFSETDVVGGGFALAFRNATATEFRGEIGARFDKALIVGDGMSLTLKGRAAYAYDSVTDPGLLANFQAAFAPGALSGANVGFGVTGAPLPKSVFIGSAGTELRLGSNWAVISKFDGQFASGARVYSGTGTLRYSW
jgi:autotransporter-associated beta strand protein